jgi:hypothetical protein
VEEEKAEHCQKDKEERKASYGLGRSSEERDLPGSKDDQDIQSLINLRTSFSALRLASLSSVSVLAF